MLCTNEATLRQKCLLGGLRLPQIPLQISCCRSLRKPGSTKSTAVAASREGGKYLVNGLQCRLQDSKVISNQACRFQNFFLGPIRNAKSGFELT